MRGLERATTEQKMSALPIAVGGFAAQKDQPSGAVRSVHGDNYTGPLAHEGPQRRSIREMPTYPANLCPLLWRPEFSDCGEDLGQAIGKSIKAIP
jgi:hypothetical protein